MNIRHILPVLVLLFILGGALLWKFSAKNEVSPATKSAASASAKPIVSPPALAVVAPKAAPVVGPDKAPAEFTPEDRKWVDSYIKADEQTAANIGKIVGTMNTRFLAQAPDDEARAKMEKSQQDFQQNYAAGLLKQADLLRHAKPPEDLGEIPIAGLPQDSGKLEAPTAPRFTLSGGESFTVALHYTGWWSLLISEQDVPGATGPYAGKYYHQLAIGEPTILLMNDGTLAKFTIVGTMPGPPASSDGPRMGFSGSAGMGRNPVAQ